MQTNSELTPFLLKLLRAAIYNDNTNLEDFPQLSPKEWNALFELAKKQTVATVMLDGLNMLPEGKLPPQDLLLMWVATADAAERRNIRMGEAIANLFGLLEVEGLHPVLHKGHASARFYPNPALRTPGDIDIAFPAEERDKARNIVLKRGLAARRHSDGSDCFRYDGCDVEFHTDLFPESGANATMEISGYKVRIPSPMQELLMLNRHLLRHSIGSGIGLRQFCDFALASKALDGKYDVTRYLEECERQGMMKWTMLLQAFIKEYLYNNKSEYQFGNQDTARLLAIVEKGGNFGKYYPGMMRRPNSPVGNKMRTVKLIARNAPFGMRIAPKVTVSSIIRLIKGQME